MRKLTLDLAEGQASDMTALRMELGLRDCGAPTLGLEKLGITMVP